MFVTGANPPCIAGASSTNKAIRATDDQSQAEADALRATAQYLHQIRSRTNAWRSAWCKRRLTARTLMSGIAPTHAEHDDRVPVAQPSPTDTDTDTGDEKTLTAHVLRLKQSLADAIEARKRSTRALQHAVAQAPNGEDAERSPRQTAIAMAEAEAEHRLLVTELANEARAHRQMWECGDAHLRSLSDALERLNEASVGLDGSTSSCARAMYRTGGEDGVRAWLCGLHLSEYLVPFLAAGIDSYDAIVKLDEATLLHSIGMLRGHARLVIAAKERLADVLIRNPRVLATETSWEAILVEMQALVAAHTKEGP